jgi:hypothetical protein
MAMLKAQIDCDLLVLVAASMLRCMLTGEFLPSANIIAAHIFKFCWAAFSRPFLNIEDIDDPRNGLLIRKAVEDVFDTSALCFVFEEETQR